MLTHITPHITALQAQATANLFLSDHLPDRFTADQARFNPAVCAQTYCSAADALPAPGLRRFRGWHFHKSFEPICYLTYGHCRSQFPLC